MGRCGRTKGRNSILLITLFVDRDFVDMQCLFQRGPFKRLQAIVICSRKETRVGGLWTWMGALRESRGSCKNADNAELVLGLLEL
uniref:Uncharacterized protein n=1 Tax=Bursaphelenchus xylophilus TaxID=6326 RepID=A0A1I7S4M5_BURXY